MQRPVPGLILRADKERLVECLSLASDGDFEILTRQVRDVLPVTVRYHRVDGDQVRGCAEDRDVLGCGDGGLLRRERDVTQQEAGEKAEPDSHQSLH